jgi:hypothetical protein
MSPSVSRLIHCTSIMPKVCSNYFWLIWENTFASPFKFIFLLERLCLNKSTR